MAFWRLRSLAVIGLTAGLVPAQSSRTIARQVDHVLFATPDGRSLVSLLTERLSLPIVFPQPGDEWTASTGIGFGNVTLEVFHRPPASPSEAPMPASINSLAVQPADLELALQELRTRDIAFAPPAPGPRWTNVALRGFGHGLFLVQYVFDMDERRARFNRVLRERDGGPLGIVRVFEVAIVVDVTASVRDQWTKLLGSSASSERDVWVVGDGPRIRLVGAADPRAGHFVVEVKSLAHAAEAVRRLRIDADITAREIRIASGAFSGLHLVLRDQQDRTPSLH
jgi:hypothetical protein